MKPTKTSPLLIFFFLSFFSNLIPMHIFLCCWVGHGVDNAKKNKVVVICGWLELVGVGWLLFVLLPVIVGLKIEA